MQLCVRQVEQPMERVLVGADKLSHPRVLLPQRHTLCLGLLLAGCAHMMQVCVRQVQPTEGGVGWC